MSCEEQDHCGLVLEVNVDGKVGVSNSCISLSDGPQLCWFPAKPSPNTLESV